jgi:hypothetical protein
MGIFGCLEQIEYESQLFDLPRLFQLAMALQSEKSCIELIK